MSLLPADPVASRLTGVVPGAGPSRWASPALTVEPVLLLASLYWTLTANHTLIAAAAADRSPADPASWVFFAALLVILVCGHALIAGIIVSLLAGRRSVKPVLALLTVAAAAGSFFIDNYGTVLDATMLRNVFRTDAAEASELLSPRLALHMLLFTGLPLVLLWRTRIVVLPRRRAGWRRARFLLVMALAMVGSIWAVFQPFSSLIRNQREVRYMITPANILWSSASAMAGDARQAVQARRPIGLDAAPGPSWAARTASGRPLVVVLVIGETARAANWGLSGYARQTTPQLATLPVINFTQATSCGTNTEVSLPCMFAPVGRRQYDEARIRGQESLLHVAARAGVAVHWRDNQSGCKGVCEGLPSDIVGPRLAPGLCDGDRCLDEGLLRDLPARLKAARGTQLWVLHTLGSHGPSYYRRYPPAFERFEPACRNDDLRRCSIDEVVNAYDNSLLYTDHVLASAIRTLQAHAGQVDTALLYVSDHGESLGERGLFLHGLPFAVAPDVQTRVPMVFWSSPGFERGAGLASGCLDAELRRQSGLPLTHDHLFHSLLGLLDVQTTLREPALDLVAACRKGAAQP